MSFGSIEPMNVTKDFTFVSLTDAQNECIK